MAEKFIDSIGLGAVRDWVISTIEEFINGLADTAQSIDINEYGQLDIGGRLGQDPTTTGIFSPKSIVPRLVDDYSLMITEANGFDFAMKKSLGVVTGSNITLKTSAPAGSTTYQVANNYANRIVCSALVGGYVALNEDWAKANQVAKVSSVQINGADYVPNSSANSSTANIVITTETSANPNTATTTIRGYGAFPAGGYSNLAIGQNVSIGANTTGASAVIGSSCRTSGNWCLVAGNGHYNDAARSAVFGTNNINRKQNAFLAGQGHDSTSAPVAVGAVGRFSNLTAQTLFAVGNGTSHTARKNAFEVQAGGIVLLSPNGARWLIKVDNEGNLSTEAL